MIFQMTDLKLSSVQMENSHASFGHMQQSVMVQS